jgi:DUF4097 and DUF4098 domain-containing protein YvlB
MKALARKSWAGVVALALILSACSNTNQVGTPGGPSNAAEAKVTQSCTVNGPAVVTIETYNGDISVKASSGDQVLVEVTKHGGGTTEAEAKTDLDNIQLSFTQAAGTVKLAATHKGRVPANSAASFIVSIPPSSTLVATIDNGVVSVDGVMGDVTATSNNGDVTITNAGPSDVSAKSTNGSVRVSGKEVASVKASTANGNVAFSGSIAGSKAANRLDVGNGNVEVTLPKEVQFNLDAATSNGKVVSDFVFEGNASPTAVKGALGTAPAFGLTIRVKNGSIALKSS